MGVLLYAYTSGYLDVTTTSIAHVNGLKPQIHNAKRDITALNSSVNKRRGELDDGASSLWWESKFVNTHVLHTNSDGYLETTNTSIEHINGLQGQIDDVDGRLPNQDNELRPSVGRFHGASLKDIASSAQPYTTRNAQGLILGNQQAGHYVNHAQIRISEHTSLKITGAGTNDGRRVEFDASVTILGDFTVYGIADLFRLDATLIDHELKSVVEYTTRSVIDASTLFANYQPLINASTAVAARLCSTKDLNCTH